MPLELNLNQLKAFYFAVSCGSITLAAEKLFITQPAVSMQIKGLEQQYGVPLLVRGKKRLELTEPGKRLYQVAVKIFGLVSKAEEILAQAGGFPSEELRIGSTKTLVRYMLAAYVARFRESFPNIQIRINEGSSADMVQSLLEPGGNDLVIVGRLAYQEKLKAIPFIQDELVVVAAPGHPLCEKDEVSIVDLAREHIILREKGSGTRRLIDRVFDEHGVEPSAFIETGNVDFILEIVKTGNGVTLLAGMGIEHEVRESGLKMIPLKEGPLVLDIDIVVNKEKPLTRADEAFLNLLMEWKAFRPTASPERREEKRRD